MKGASCVYHSPHIALVLLPQGSLALFSRLFTGSHTLLPQLVRFFEDKPKSRALLARLSEPLFHIHVYFLGP